MKTVRTIIKSRLREMGWKPYHLAKAVRSKVAPQTIYSFLNGSREMSTKHLHLLLAAVGLEIRPKA